MSAETKKVLEMLAEGKITADDAERLLDKLAAKSPEETGNGNGSNSAKTRDTVTVRKFLRVLVDTGDGHDVNVRIPLAFLRSGVKLLSVLPPKVAKKLTDKGFNPEFLTDLRGEDLEEALNTLHVDINTDEGQHVQVFCE
ncbi:MAG: hypothetical protein WBW69_02820 [Candidatus Korobacteraceae bacterium]